MRVQVHSTYPIQTIRVRSQPPLSLPANAGIVTSCPALKWLRSLPPVGMATVSKSERPLRVAVLKTIVKLSKVRSRR